MGQYFLTVSLENRQYIDPSSTDNGSKLMETAWQYNDYVFSIAKRLFTTWRDTRVITVGDYNDEDFEGSLPDDIEKKFLKVKPPLGLPKNSSTEWWRWQEIMDKFYQDKVFYNLNKKEYLHLGKYFEKRIEDRDLDSMIENPITLLLSTGNGGGTFREGMLGADIVGSWAGDFVGIKTGLSTVEAIQWKDVTNQYIFDEKMPQDLSPLISVLPDFYESGISKGEEYIFATCLIKDSGSDFFAFEYSPKKRLVFGCYRNNPYSKVKKFEYLMLSACFNIQETNVSWIFKDGQIK